MSRVVRISKELEFAIELVAECTAMARKIQGRMVSSALEKTDRSPVTVADFALQALAGRRILDAFPDARLVAEESSDALRQEENSKTVRAVSEFLAETFPDTIPDKVRDWIDAGQSEAEGRYWVLDPIDGTKGFLRNAHYAVALALVEEGELLLGVLGCPTLALEPNGESRSYDLSPVGPGVILYAEKGAGTWIRNSGSDTRLEVSRRKEPAQARILRSFETGHTDASMLSAIARLVGIRNEPVKMDSQAKYALLAAGCADLLFRLISPKRPDYREKIWDQAAGVLIVREAGGRVTDLDGRELDFTTGQRLERNRGIIASNSRLHEAALEAVGTLGA